MQKDTLPPPPEKPSPEECCGSGCVPCIYDYYYDQLDEWNSKYGANSKSSEAAKQIKSHS